MRKVISHTIGLLLFRRNAASFDEEYSRVAIVLRRAVFEGKGYIVVRF